MESMPVNWDALDSIVLDYAIADNLLHPSSPSSSPSLSPTLSLSSSSYHSRLLIQQIHQSLGSGDVDSALHLLQRHAPSVLDDHRLLFRLHKQKFIELLRKGTDADRDSAIRCLRMALAPFALDAYPRIVFAVRRLALEARHRHKDSSLCEGLQWVISPVTGELTIAPVEEEAKPLLAYLHSKFGFNISLQVKENQEREGHEEEEEEEVWFSVRSDFSCCSSPVERKEIFLDCAWRSLLEKLSFCEGWPFGLYRRKMMLPPLPRCPSEPWMWHKAMSNTC
ncbi:hypothetical protein AMTRI_Chr04g185720 [Amborella trichopoda]